MTDPNRKCSPLTCALRNCSFEPLEDRILLTASGWGGFDPNPVVSHYAVESSAISIDFSGNDDLDLVGITDLDGDGKNDLITVNGADSAPRLTPLFGDGTGSFSAGGASELGVVPGYAAAGLLADLTGDGILDYLSVSQNMSNDSILNLNLYTYQEYGSFELQKTCSISLSVFGSYSVYAVTSIQLASVGSDLVIQLQNSFGFDSSGRSHSLDGTAVCKNSGSGTFTNPKLIASFTGTASGSINLDGTDYLISLNKETRTFGFWSYNSAKSAWSNSGNISYTASVGNLAAASVAVSGSQVWLSGNLGGSTVICGFSLKVDSAKVVLDSSQLYSLQRARSMSAILSCGDLNGDSYSDLLLTDAHRYTALLGDSAGSYTEVGTTVAQTDYLAAVEIDFDGDGTNEYLTVGAIGVWTVDMNDPEADPIQYGIFDNEISAAVFGDYDGDGALEIAVLESETNRAALYDFAGGQYQRVQLISPLSDIEKGIVINAVGTRIAVGKFTATDHDQILIQYTWETEAGDSIVVYDPVQRQTVQRIDLHDSETVEALAVGKLYTLAGRDDLAVVVSKGSILYALSWENISGVLTRQVGVKLGAGAEYQINDLAIGDLNSDKFGDLVFLNSNADNSGIGWLTKNGTTGFSISGLGWGETISVDGTFSGLLLADITGDGVLDVVTTQQSTDTDGTNRSFLYISEGNSRGKSLFGPLVYSPLAGEYAAGIDFDGGGADAPFLTYRRNEETGLGDVILAKGRSLVLVQSKEGGTGEEGFYYLVRSASSELPEETAVYPDLSDAYTWVDEWSSFYIEVWGTANGSILYQFKTELAFNSACWTVESVESGTAFTASVSVDEGSFYLTGYSTSSIAPREGEYVLLARVLMAPTETGGVAIPDDGVFQAYNAGFSVIEGSESINGAYFCSESYRDALEDLDLFSVRFDVNDDGAVNIKDFTVFAGDYGRGTESAPYKNPKSATFDVVSTGNGLNIQDFTVFAKSYGMTAAGITERFYDRIGIDPNSWLAASAELADELEDELFEEVSESAPEYVLPLLPQEDEEEEWFLTLF